MNNRLCDRINSLVPGWRERRRGPGKPANDDTRQATNAEKARDTHFRDAEEQTNQPKPAQ